LSVEVERQRDLRLANNPAKRAVEAKTRRRVFFFRREIGGFFGSVGGERLISASRSGIMTAFRERVRRTFAETT